MTGPQTRATILIVDIASLGPDLQALVATAAHGPRRSPTLAEHIAAVESTFTPATAATYGCHWRLAVAASIYPAAPSGGSTAVLVRSWAEPQ